MEIETHIEAIRCEGFVIDAATGGILTGWEHVIQSLRDIFDTRMLADEPETLRELGERFGVSRERVRQLEADLKKRLKAFLEQFSEVIDILESPDEQAR